jgi:hypothetical protein
VTFAELKFLYGLLLRGWDDEAILAEYARLKQEGKLEFPFRRDASFLRERRKELAAQEAARCSFDQLPLEPGLPAYQAQHFQQLRAVAATLITGTGGKITPHGVDGDGRPMYLLESGEATTHDELTSSLLNNLFYATELHSRRVVSEYLVPHLESGYFNSRSLLVSIKERPADFVNTILDILCSNTFKGSCPVCVDWQP